MYIVCSNWKCYSFCWDSIPTLILGIGFFILLVKIVWWAPRAQPQMLFCKKSTNIKTMQVGQGLLFFGIKYYNNTLPLFSMVHISILKGTTVLRMHLMQQLSFWFSIMQSTCRCIAGKSLWAIIDSKSVK